MDSRGGSLYARSRQEVAERRADAARPGLQEDRMGIVALLALGVLVGVVISNSGGQPAQPTTQEQRTPR
jgi:hypothetical protein